MWDFPVAAINANSIAFLLFFALWLLMMGTYLHFAWRVAPAALRRWAEAEGYEVIERKQAGPFDWFTFAGGSGHHVYRVVVRDRDGHEHSGLVRLGTPYWFCSSASRCPVEVRWREAVGTLEQFRRLTDPARFGWKGGSSSHGQAVTRRTVFCFAVADLILAIPLLALVLGSLLIAACSVDEVWPNSLGLNRHIQRTPGAYSLPESWQNLAMSLGYFILYLPALVTLTAGGIGMLLRRRWGYSCHVAASVLIVVTCIGAAYTIPALAFAFRSEFKAYFEVPKSTKPPAHSLEDL